MSASGRAFFVFWSLLAVPSLTILISNMGDTIVKGIRDLTLWVGEFTVLPGEHGMKTTLKKSAHKMSGGRVFEDPPGLLGETQRRASSDSTAEGGRNDPEGAGQHRDANEAVVEGEQAKKRAGHKELPASKHEYHVLLISEIAKVMRHIHSSPPRKYSFEEWAWYLKLVGEDESEPEGHRKAMRKVTPREVGEGAGMGEKVEWSWIGVRSPLMGGKDEAEWVLERLTKTLHRELEDMRREEEEMRGALRERDGRREERGRSTTPQSEGEGEEEGKEEEQEQEP